MVHISTKEARSMILGVGNHNIFKTLQFAKAHKDEIQAYIQGKSYEGYDDPMPDGGAEAGISIGVILVVIILSLGFWIWALVVTLKYFNVLPQWAQILAILGLVGVGGPILTLIAVYVGKCQGNGQGKGSRQ